MNVQEIINRTRRLTYTNAIQYPDTTAMEDFNIIYKQVCNSLTQEVNEDYFWDIFTTNSVIWQNEYRLSSDMFKLKSVSVKYKIDWEYIPAFTQETTQLTNDRDYYKTNQNTSNPFYTIDDNSIFIFPTPTEVVVDWVKIEAIIKPSSLVIWATEDNILLPSEYHYIISEWMKQFAYQAKWKLEEKNDAINEYKIKMRDMIFELNDRNNSPTTRLLPNLDYYS